LDFSLLGAIQAILWLEWGSCIRRLLDRMYSGEMMQEAFTHTDTAAAPAKLQLPPGDFKAYLFDCDGTIVDSMPLHFIAWSKALGEWNCPFPEDVFYAWGGLPRHEIIERLRVQHGLDIPVSEVGDRKEAIYYENLPQLKAVPEVLEHIKAQHGRIPFAVVSGSTRDSVQASLRTLGLLDRFDVLVCAGDYAKSKPHPEPFLLAAEKLGVAPESCLVFEDTQMGIDAAEAAGMSWVRVAPPSQRL
jgi:HAD superfamily hydrolase (TIGR01509 family)